MVAWLAAGLQTASLLFLEEVYELSDRSFPHAELFLTGMRHRCVYARKPWRVCERYGTIWSLLRVLRACDFTRSNLRFDLREPFLQISEASSHRSELTT